MGYEVTRFTHEIDEEFYCSICKMVLKDMTQSPCEHVFCNECIKGWLAVDQSCPVERGPLQLRDLKPAMRGFRNVVNKFEIKCDFELEGCAAVVKLENLEDHVGRCEYHPNATVICDKGCDIEMRREEYSATNCFKHLADQTLRQDEKIKNLNDQVSFQYEKFEKLMSEVVNLRDEVGSLRRQQEDSVNQMIRQNDKIATLHDEAKVQSKEIQRLSDENGRRENEISKLKHDLIQLGCREDEFVKVTDEICSRRSQIEQFQDEIILKDEDIAKLSNDILNGTNDFDGERPKFRVWENMKISIDQPNVLEVDNHWGYAQLVYSLEQIKFSFKIEILSLESYIEIGLAVMWPSDRKLSESVFNERNGSLFIDGKYKYTGLKWKVGDIIECGINFVTDVNDGRQIQVYFNKNGESFREFLIAMSIYGLFPTVGMGKGTKIKYLSS